MLPRIAATAGTRRLVVAVATVAGLTGCAAGGAASPSPSVTPPSIPASPTPVPADATLSEVHLPLDAYQLDPQDTATVLNAINTLTATCMRAKGFAYAASAVTSQSVADTPSGGGYGLDNAQQAAEYGYSSAKTVSRMTALEQGKQPGQQGSGHSDAYWIALDGSVPGAGAPGFTTSGCYNSAANQIMQYTEAASSHLDLSLPGDLVDEAQADAAKDSRVTHVTAAWSACMADQGFHYPTPAAAAQAHWPPIPSSTEKNTAVADVACKQRTNLPGVWQAVQAGYEQELISANLPALTAVAQHLTGDVNRAEKILASGPSS
ncbi:MAG TPA: hypothetical protein VMU95_36335 [Trebonia sp.]|nr:hypothetical protein [Trebonia sp.]